jgi:MFS family permease
LRHARLPPADRARRATVPSLALAPFRPSGHHGAVNHHALGHSRLAWLDRFLVPRETPLAPSRWHQHIVQRRVSRLDHLRPHRLNWEALKQPEHASADDHEALTPRRLAGIRWSWLDGLFTTVSDNLYLGFILLYALAYGASTSQIGLLTAVQNLLGAVSLFPGARAADAARHRKPLVTWTVGGFARVALLALALVPWLTNVPATAIWLIIALNGIRSFMSNFGNPAWTVLVGDLVPLRLRALYFGNRNLMIMLAALLVAPLAGWLIKVGNGWLGQPYLGYQAVLALAFVAGLAGTGCFLRIPEPHRVVPARVVRETGASLWTVVAGNRAFLGLVVSGFVWNLALQVAAPFFNVYLVRHLGAGAGTVGLLAGVNTLLGLVGSWLFGRVMDRFGALKTQAVAGLLIPIIPTAWIWITAPWQVGVFEAYSGLVWAGYNLANFALLLELTPASHRPQAVALYQTVVFASAVVGPLLGGWLADEFGFRVIFGLSGAGRLVGILLYIWLSVWPILVAQRSRPATAPAGAA